MTKLLEWLSVLTGLFTLWLALVTNKLENSLTKQYGTLILFSPIILVTLFGVYAATVVFYRVLTFNNCEQAAVELKKQIEEAEAELKLLGYIYKKMK